MSHIRTSVAAALCLSGGLAASTPAATGVELPADFGASVRPSSTNMEDLESLVGRDFDNTRLFFRWDDVFPTEYVTYLKGANQQMMISVKAQTRRGVVIKWADIANAQPGSAVHNSMVRWARALRDLQVDVFFTFHHEPEAEVNTDNGTADQYQAAWRNFHSVFQSQGASNVDFMWIMTAQAFRVSSTDRRQAAKWYPGDQYVEGIASDAYNWYTCRTDVKSPWRSLEFLIDGQRRFGVAHPDERLYLTEWASAEDPSVPGRKAAWFREAQALLKTTAYSQFEGVTYFNIPGQGNCVWRVDSSATSLQAFSEMGHDPYFGG